MKKRIELSEAAGQKLLDTWSFYDGELLNFEHGWLTLETEYLGLGCESQIAENKSSVLSLATALESMGIASKEELAELDRKRMAEMHAMKKRQYEALKKEIEGQE